MAEVGIFIAFIAGLVSFLAPCVLPLLPGYIAYLAGSSLDRAKSDRYQIFINSIFFVLGFSAVFSIIGVLLNSILSNIAFSAQVWLSRIGGTIIIFFGLYLAGFMHIGILEKDHKYNIKHKFKSRYLGSFIFGTAFAAGWTPCCGAALGAIIGLASSRPEMAFALLFSYSLGFGLPLILLGFFADRASVFIHKYSKIITHINIVFGIILIIFGILVFTQTVNRLVSFEWLNSLLLK